MAKKMKPNLKGFLTTGKRSVGELEPAGLARTASEEAVLEPEAQTPVSKDAFLDLLAPPDREMWKAVLDAGIGVELRGFDAAAIGKLGKEFQSMDRTRFTLYALPEKGAALRPVRSAAQIQESLALLLEWDEMGTLTVYAPA